MYKFDYENVLQNKSKDELIELIDDLHFDLENQIDKNISLKERFSKLLGEYILVCESIRKFFKNG